AGTIIHHRGSVRGLTTAAGIWCTAAIGLAAGFGLYIPAVAATVMVVSALWLLDIAEQVLPIRRSVIAKCRTRYEPGIATDVADRVRAAGFSVGNVHFRREAGDPSDVEITLRVGMRTRHQAVRELERFFHEEFNAVTLVSTRPVAD